MLGFFSQQNSNAFLDLQAHDQCVIFYSQYIGFQGMHGFPHNVFKILLIMVSVSINILTKV